MRRLLAVITALIFAATLTACSNSVSTSELETQISDTLEAQVGQAPDDVTCEEALPAEVGATTRCELTDGEDVYGVDVTVTSVEGNVVNFDIEVSETPIQ